MDYEKKYKDALDRAKGMWEQGMMPERIEYIFPELKESEDDRIRIALKEYFINSFQNNGVAAICGVHIKDVLAWLEKQCVQKPIISNNALREGIAYFGITQYQIDNWLKKYVDVEKQSEQKPAPKFNVGDTMRTLQEANDGYTDGMPVVVSIDNEYYHCTNELISIKDQDDYEFPPINIKQKPANKVEPKFKVGDWIIRNAEGFKHNAYRVTEVKDYYGCEDFKGRRVTFTFNDVHKNFKLLDISDAKDEIIVKLWDLLDSIDTYANLQINGSETDRAFSWIEDKAKERHKFVKSDGYDLFIDGEKIIK